MSPGRLTLFNHLGRLIEDLGGDRDAKLLSRLQVDDEVELRRPLHWKVGRIGVFENFETVPPGFSIAKVLASTPAMARPLSRLGGVDKIPRQKKGRVQRETRPF